MKLSKLSVFLPAYNEEMTIERVVLSVLTKLKKIAEQYELIVINDGSSDETRQIIERLAEKYSEIKLINHPKNKGYGGALKTGMKNAKYDWICYMDSDGQFDFNEFDKFLKQITKADLIIGYRKKRKDSFFRILLAKCLWLVDLILFGVSFKDIDCGFKLFKKTALEKIGPLITESAITESELVVRIKKADLKIIQIPVTHYLRNKGVQTGAKLKVVTKAAIEGIILWFDFFKHNLYRKEFWLLFLILCLGAFLRFYKISDYMTFLGDEGRDALVVKRMIVDHKFTLLGPTASVGGFFLGPIYYYFMIPFILLFNLNPVGGAVMVALFGVATIFLIYKFCKEFLNERIGLLATFIYSISTLVIIYSRSSWNPNILPFFSLALIYALAKAVLKNKKFYFWIIGLFLGIILQLHYMGVLLIPVIIITYLFLAKKKRFLKDFLQMSIGFFITFSPLLLFELRHSFPNTRSLVDFIFKGKEVGLLVFHEPSRQVINNYFFALVDQLFRQTLVFNNLVLGKIVFFISLLGFLIEFIKPKITKRKTLIFLLVIVSSLLFMKLYKKAVYDYYLAYLFPYPAIFFSLAGVRIINKRKILMVMGIILLMFVIKTNYDTNILHKSPNKQMKQTKKIAEMIIDKAEGKSFNFALITHGNSDHGYRYFLETAGYKPKLLEEEITEQLLVVCEQSECRPLGHPLWEVAGFGRAEIVGSWQAPAGFTIFRLNHHEESIDFIGKPAPKG